MITQESQIQPRQAPKSQRWTVLQSPQGGFRGISISACDIDLFSHRLVSLEIKPLMNDIDLESYRPNPESMCRERPYCPTHEVRIGQFGASTQAGSYFSRGEHLAPEARLPPRYTYVHRKEDQDKKERIAREAEARSPLPENPPPTHDAALV